MQTTTLLEEIKHTYGEWLEMAAHHEDKMIIDILLGLLVKEKEKTQYLEKLLRR